ncbi:MAG: hypothetical protein KGL39_36165 [Patescibacteria group bacterium]|nr:hypothetical protein [Patescibacteria group bacterium]
MYDPRKKPNDSEARLIRIESRLCKLMEHLGLDSMGNPLDNPRKAPEERRPSLLPWRNK